MNCRSCGFVEQSAITPSLPQRWWLEQDKEPRWKSRRHGGIVAAGPESEKDGLQNCLSKSHVRLLFDNKNPLACSRNRNMGRSSVGHSGDEVSGVKFPLHLNCSHFTGGLMLYPKGTKPMAVFAETRIPAPLDFKYLVYFQTSPRTQVWSFGFGHYTLGRSPVKDTVAWWKHLMMETEEASPARGCLLSKKARETSQKGKHRWMKRWLYWVIKKAEGPRTDAFELWCWRRLLRVPWTARRSNQSILKERSPEYSLEGLLLKLKLQYFGHLIRRTDLLGKTLMPGKTDGRRRRRRQRTRWLDGVPDSKDMNLGKLWEIVKYRGAWCAADQGVTKIWTRLSDWTTATTLNPHLKKKRVFALPKNPLQVFTARYLFTCKISFDSQRKEGNMGSL